MNPSFTSINLAERLRLPNLRTIFPTESSELESKLALGLAQLQRHGSLSKWLRPISELPDVSPDLALDLDAPQSSFSPQVDIDPCLIALKPWKKGPFQIGERTIDAEWRSDLKWARVQEHLGRLDGQSVLDVGTGNGYFLLRALGSGARHVVGLEPGVLSVAQHLFLSHFFPCPAATMVPLACEQFVLGCRRFDLVMSMGVLYHRRSPLGHLDELISFARPGGRVLVETIVIEGGAGACLSPPGRYANMRNVFFLPSLDTLLGWVRRLGLRHISVGPSVRTTVDEQRSTSLSGPISLQEALDPKEPSLTIEGHPAPMRVIVSGKVPSIR